MEENINNWIPLKGYEGYYEIQVEGKIRSLHKKSNNKIINVRIDRGGYCTVRLSKHGRCKTHYLHRLLAFTFLPATENKNEINHKNGIKTDNSILNLEWTTHKENINHAYKYHLVKLKAKMVFDIYSGLLFLNSRTASEYYGIKYNTLRNYLKGNIIHPSTGLVYLG